MEARKPWRDHRLWILLAGTLLTLGLAWTAKAPCLYETWDGFQYENLCYNDIQPLYYLRGVSEDAVPYVQEFNEYPVLTGLLMYLTGLLSADDTAFFLWNAVFLGLCALGTTVLLFLQARNKRLVAFWAAGPPLILYAFHNWDLLAVFFGVLGIVLFQRDRYVASGIALAAGASSKLFPGFFVPFLLIVILRRDRRLGTDAWRLVLGFAGTLFLINAPFLFANPDLFWETYRYHLGRLPNFETIWYAILHYARKWDLDVLEKAATGHTLEIFIIGLMVVFAAVVGIGTARGRIDALYACFGAAVLFMLFNKIFSVQYALWILPFFALLPLSRTKFAVFVSGDVAVYIAVFTFFLHIRDSQFEATFETLALAVALRTAALAWLLAHVVRLALDRKAGPAVRRPLIDRSPRTEPGPASVPLTGRDSRTG